MLRKVGTSCVALGIAIGSLLVAQEAMAQFDGENANHFAATRDAGIFAHESEQMLVELNLAGRHRPLKSNQNTSIMDFDTVAMQAILDANPGMTATWTLNLSVSQDPAAFNPPPFEHVPVFAGEVGIQTIESTNDWSTTDNGGLDNGGLTGNFGWAPGTSSPSFFYAETFYKPEVINGIPTKVVDTALSKPWDDPDSGLYTFTNRTPNHAEYGVPFSGPDAIPDANPTPGFTNSESFTKDEFIAAWFGFRPASIGLDSNIIDAMLNDPNNRGIRTGKNFGPGGVVDNTNGGNFRLFDTDQSTAAAGLKPYLEVSFSLSVGLPGDFNDNGVVDAADYSVWLDNLGSSFDLNGNGDEAGGSAGVVDAADYALWNGAFGNTTGVATGGAVPEPSTILLLCSGLFAWAGGRRRIAA